MKEKRKRNKENTGVRKEEEKNKRKTNYAILE